MVESVSGTTVNIVKDGYKHIPFVGDVIGVAPEEIGGEMTGVTVTAVKTAKVGEVEVWACTVSATITAPKGTVLVEAEKAGESTMLVKNINAFADCDGDMPYVGADSADDFEKAKYFYTPAVGGVYIYIHKMSPLPKCVLAVNKSQFNGLFKLPTVG